MPTNIMVTLKVIGNHSESKKAIPSITKENGTLTTTRSKSLNSGCQKSGRS